MPLRILNRKSFTAKFAEEAQSTAEPFIVELLCGTLRKTLRLSAV